MVGRIDNLTKYIQEQLIAKNLDKRVNVIYVSDHGMESVSPPNFIDLTTFLTNGTYTMYGSSPVLQVVPTKPGNCFSGIFFCDFERIKTKTFAILFRI